jgi:hypothetical protein
MSFALAQFIGKSDEELEIMWERAYSKSNEELELIQNNNARVHAISQHKNCELEKQNKDRLQAMKKANSSAAAKLRGTLTKHLDVEKGAKRKIKMLLQQPRNHYKEFKNNIKQATRLLREMGQNSPHLKEEEITPTLTNMLRSDIIVAENEVSQRWALPQHSCKTLCPTVANIIAAEIEVSQRCALPHARTHTQTHLSSCVFHVLNHSH